MIHTVTNLYPYPTQPTRGLFNLQLFRELGKLTEVRNSVLVANTNPRHAAAIRSWKVTPDLPDATYIPYQHIPFIGRNFAWRVIAHALSQRFTDQGVARRCTSQAAQRAGREVQPRTTLQVSQSTPHSPQPTVHCPLPTAVLASWLYPDGTATAMAFRNSGIPIWTMVLGTDRFHLRSSVRRKAILKADQHTAGYICVSQNIADDLVSLGMPKGKLHVIRNGVDTDRFHPMPRDEALNQLPPSVARGCTSQSVVRGCTSQSVARGCTSQSVARGCTSQPANGGNIESTRNRPSTVTAMSKTNDNAVFRASPGGEIQSRATILFIGNLIPIKAPDVALRAFAAFHEGASPDCISQSVARGCTSQPAQRAGRPHSVLRTAAPYNDAPHATPEERGIPAKAGCEVQPRATPQPSALSPHPFSLVFIGDGPMRPALEKLAAELKIADHVHFLGRRPHDEIPLWLNAADALLLSSISEGMPNAVSEALACGCPVVATDVGACREMLEAQPCCATVPIDDPQAMAHELRSVLQESQQTQERPKFTRTWAHMAQDILELIEAARVDEAK